MEALLAVLGVQLLAGIAVGSLHQFDAWLRRTLPFVISIAVGVLLATGIGHLLPEAVDALGNRPALWCTLIMTMLALYSFERAFHVLSGVRVEPMTQLDCEHEDGSHHHGHGASRPATLLMGAVIHSLVDGTSIAAAFAVDRRVGWVTALAVGLHEIPHRLGDFALLLHMGLTRGKAASLAIGAGASSLIGWMVVAALGAQGSGRVAWLLPVSAGSFLYISLVDLLPELQQERRRGVVIGQILCLAAGAALALGLTSIPGA